MVRFRSFELISDETHRHNEKKQRNKNTLGIYKNIYTKGFLVQGLAVFLFFGFFLVCCAGDGNIPPPAFETGHSGWAPTATEVQLGFLCQGPSPTAVCA